MPGTWDFISCRSCRNTSRPVGAVAADDFCGDIHRKTIDFPAKFTGHWPGRKRGFPMFLNDGHHHLMKSGLDMLRYIMISSLWGGFWLGFCGPIRVIFFILESKCGKLIYGSFMATKKGENVTNVMIIDQPKWLWGYLRQINRITILVDKFSGHPKVGLSGTPLPRESALVFDPYQNKIKQTARKPKFWWKYTTSAYDIRNGIDQ